MGVLKARILKWFAIPFSSGPHSVRPLHHDLSILGGPIKPEVKEELKPIIESLKEQGLFIPFNSPYNTPIWGLKISNNKWRLIQDM